MPPDPGSSAPRRTSGKRRFWDPRLTDLYEECRRLRDSGCTNPAADPDHRRWLLNRWRKAIRERREAHQRA